MLRGVAKFRVNKFLYTPIVFENFFNMLIFYMKLL